MAKLTVIGRLGKVEERQGGYISFGVAEPSYKDKNGEFVTPWYNFLISAESANGKFILNYGSSIDVVCIECNQRQVKKADGANGFKTEYFNNILRIERVTSKKKADDATSNANVIPQNSADNTSQEEDDFPWKNM